MAIDEKIFHKFDLNTLVTFMAVYQTRGVSLAAQALNVTQPAVSNVLSQLRQRFDDPLFRPRGRRMAPTPRAIEIANALEPAMAVMQGIIRLDCKASVSHEQESGS